MSLDIDQSAIIDTQPRKRRRRTAGGGAQDDCFACRRRGTSCDRKRPYCTQCIEEGKECSGYKTTLTWGVGVASRGKLRGLSLPVTSKTSETPISRRKSSVSSKNNRPKNLRIDAQQSAPIPIPRSNASNDLPIVEAQSAWDSVAYSTSTPADNRHYSLSSNPSLKHIQTTFGSQLDGMTWPDSASSTGSFMDADFQTALEFQHSPSSIPYREDPFQHQYPLLEQSVEPVKDTSATTESLDVVYQSALPSHYDMTLTQIDENTYDEAMLPMLDMRFSNHLFHLPPRVQYLVHYYDTSICPFLVAFDGPQNPYRMHIIQLASHNEGLQNALAALATNNMRMRQKEVRLLDSSTFDNPEVSHATPEETRYKLSSIELLNMQLTQPAAAQDDSVLATLLILCLFHVCDSGFSKFKTQLAGVQKLLSMRDVNTKSAFTNWVEMFFMWFDVMTSAVNDREPQIKGESLDMLDYTVNLGALEQFSGCDGRLFKLIARLGGLSLLAQGRSTSRSISRQTPTAYLRSLRQKKPTLKAALKRSLDAADYEQLDGNGWGTPILASEDDAEGEVDGADAREDFWSMWHDIESRLQQWQVDSSSFLTSTGEPTHEQHDLVHISESFRHSALLYCQRLAHPLLPSSALEFQQHVSQALMHITALPVTSCVNKFLLWPLFITGTECVEPSHQSIIRTRCIEIQRESGFFNNISCLEVLEKVWCDIDMGGDEQGEIHARRRDSEVLAGSESRQAFRWRRAMDRIDGEYLIV